MNENNPHHSETFSAEPVLGFTRIYNIEDFVRCDSDVIHASEFHWSLWEWLFILVTCGHISFPRLSMNFIAASISLVYGRYLWEVNLGRNFDQSMWPLLVKLCASRKVCILRWFYHSLSFTFLMRTLIFLLLTCLVRNSRIDAHPYPLFSSSIRRVFLACTLTKQVLLHRSMRG